MQRVQRIRFIIQLDGKSGGGFGPRIILTNNSKNVIISFNNPRVLYLNYLGSEKVFSNLGACLTMDDCAATVVNQSIPW